jgi:hypothetical protein
MILTTTGKIWLRNTVTIIASKKCSQWLVSFTCQLRLNILLFSGLIYTWYFSPLTWDPTSNWKKTAGRHRMLWKIDLFNGQRQGSGPPELLFYGALFCIWRLSTKTAISIWGLLIFFIWEEEGLAGQDANQWRCICPTCDIRETFHTTFHSGPRSLSY